MGYLHPLTRKHLISPMRFGSMLLTTITLFSSARGLSGCVYLLLAMVLVPLIVREVEEESVVAFIDKHYGRRIGFVFSLVGVVYLTVEFVSFAMWLWGAKDVQPWFEPYAFVCVCGTMIGLIVLFQLRGIGWLQVLLFGIFITVLPLLGRKVLFSRGNVPWLKFCSGLRYSNFCGHGFVFSLLLSSVLVGETFVVKKGRESLSKACLVAMLFCLSGVVLWFLPWAYFEQTSSMIGIFCFILFGSMMKVFFVSRVFYVGATWLIHGFVPGVKHMSLLKERFITTLMLIGWVIAVMVIGDYVSKEGLILFQKNLVPLVLACQVIFLSTMVGFKASRSVFYRTLGGTLVMYILCRVFGMSTSVAVGLSLPVSIVVFLLVHYSVYEGFVFVKREWREGKAVQRYMRSWMVSVRQVVRLLLFPRYLASLSRESVSLYGMHPFRFSLFFILSHYIFPLFMTSFVPEKASLMMSYLQLGGFVLSLGLLLYPYWAQSMLYYLPLYWHITLGYCLSFSSMLCYLMSEDLTGWLLHLAIAHILLARLVGPVSYVFLTLSGIGLAVLVGSYIPLAHEGLCALRDEPEMLYRLCYTFGLTSLVGLVFIKRSSAEVRQTQEVLQNFCQKIMHKITNVVGLASSHASVLSICQKSMKVMPKKEGEGVVIEVEQAPYEMMHESISLLERDSELSQKMLKNVTRPLRMTIKPDDFALYRVAPCIQEAVDNYNLHYDPAPSVALDIDEDFVFWGDDQILVQVIFNLLDNTYIHGSPSCRVSISIQGNKIYYQDNGPGISSLDLPYIFDSFYSTSGSIGMGLSYAKKALEVFQGDIICRSSTDTEANTYTCFVISLPKKKGVSGDE